jgi:hypothetical protein
LTVTSRTAGLRVTSRTQPALFEHVAAVAARLGAPMPRRVWLTGNASVKTGSWPWRDLLIGEAFVDAMPAVHLSALVGHELTILAQPRSWLTRLVHDAWSSRAGQEETSATDKVVLDGSAAFASSVDESADRAAVVAAGSGAVSAEAFARADLLGLEHFIYRQRVGELAATALRILDVDEGWRQLLATGRGFFAPDVWNPERLPKTHPGLAYAFAEVPPLRLGQPVDRVPLAPLSDADRRRLFGVRRTSVFRRVPWRTFADVSPELVNDLAHKKFEEARDWVEQLLGRPVDDDAEVISVLVHRADDLEAQALREIGWVDEDDVDDRDDEGRSSWLLIESAEFLLLGEDWRLEHPAVSGIVISPDGRRVDLRPMRPEQMEELLTSEHALT